MKAEKPKENWIQKSGQWLSLPDKRSQLMQLELVVYLYICMEITRNVWISYHI